MASELIITFQGAECTVTLHGSPEEIAASMAVLPASSFYGELVRDFVTVIIKDAKMSVEHAY